MNVSGLLEIRLEDALEELQSLFIVNAPKFIESEPRFDIAITTALLVLSKRNELAGDHVALEKSVRSARTKAKGGASQKHNKQVALAISQALALLKVEGRGPAMETINAALKAQKLHPDLLLFKARMLAEAKPPQNEEARKLFAQAFESGARKHILFDLWYKCERDQSFGPGVIEVAEMALKQFPSEESLWVARKAEGYVLNGLVRSKNREFDQAYGELSLAAKDLYYARGKAFDGEKNRLSEFLYGVHDELMSIYPNTTAAFRTDQVSMMRELTDRGDTRVELLVALGNAVLARGAELSRRNSVGDVVKEQLEQNRQYAIDLLKHGGYRTKDLLARIQDA